MTVTITTNPEPVNLDTNNGSVTINHYEDSIIQVNGAFIKSDTVLLGRKCTLTDCNPHRSRLTNGRVLTWPQPTYPSSPLSARNKGEFKTKSVHSLKLPEVFSRRTPTAIYTQISC